MNAGGDYDVDLGQAVAGDGLVALAIDSISSTEARWSSRSTIDPPLLTVDVPHVPGTYGNGLSTVSTRFNGSAEPTYQPLDKHFAVTRGERVLVVHGRQGEGVVHAWRDAGGLRRLTDLDAPS